METMLSIVRDSAVANKPAPAPLPIESSTPETVQSSDSLRSELGAAIEIRLDCDDRARAAAEISARAGIAKAEAAAEVERLKQARDAERRGATQMHAAALVQAFRDGSTMPPAPEMPATDSSCVEAFVARLAAIEAAALPPVRTPLGPHRHAGPW
jgi:hypothetical protein